ncbi:hypothetical protein SHO565_36190 [Streptomyces sp. HO565]
MAGEAAEAAEAAEVGEAPAGGRVWRGLDTFGLRSGIRARSDFSRDPALDGEPNRFGQIDLAVSM